MGIQLAPPRGYVPPASADELVSRYEDGERYFRGAAFGGGYINHRIEGADLQGLRCRHSFTFGESDFLNCNLAGATLDGTGWWDTTMTDCDLSGTTFDYAHVMAASLSRCSLKSASFERAVLDDCSFRGSNCAEVVLSETTFLDVDLTPFSNADPPVQHRGPSRVDHRTVLASVRVPHLRDFLLRLGTPPIFAEYMVESAKALQGNVFAMMQSTFISYGSPDEAFAKRLYEALHQNGVTTFFFPVHARPGQRLHRTMREGVNSHDRVILICSKASLDRPGVLNEVEETLAREARTGGTTCLIPITLDDYVFGWAPARADLSQAIRDRVVADFRNADNDPVVFDSATARLLAELRRLPGSSAAPG